MTSTHARPLSRFATFLRTPTLARSIVVLMSAAVLLLLIVNLTTFVMIQRTAAFNEEVEDIQVVRRTARNVLIAMTDAETGQRGFLLTGQASFLVPFTQARRDAAANYAALAAAAQGDSELEAAVESVIRLSREKFIEVDSTLIEARAGRIGQAIALVRTGTGKQLMDDLRAEVSMIDTLLGVRLAERTRQSELAGSQTVAVNAVAGLLILALAGMIFVLVRRYIGELGEARDQVDRMNAGLEQTVRERTAALTRANEEVQRFAYIVSHDLRSPLVNVMGFTAELESAGQIIDRQISRLETDAPDLIESDAVTAVREDLPEAIAFIRASTEKMDRLINAILKLSREGRRGLAPEPLEMTAMMQQIADSLRHQTDAAGAEIVVEELATLESDRMAIEQIMGNLIDNAVKYLEPKRPGRIVVTGRDLPGGWVEYAVEDNGRGIAPRDHERVFELFRRAGRQDKPGEGLGLAFVKNSVRRLGGSIDIESEAGKGSTFRLKFPKRLILEDAGDIV